MARPQRADPKKIAAILTVLAKYEEGIWIRKLAKEAGIHPTTATKYVEGPLAPMVEISSLGSPDGKTLLRVVRLKSIVFQRLAEGMSLAQVMRLLSVLEKVKKA